MSRRIKFIWDFFGEDAVPTAQHHEVHLSEFVERENISPYTTGVEEIGDQQAIAYLIVSEEHLLPIRDALIPKRAQWVEEKPNS